MSEWAIAVSAVLVLACAVPVSIVTWGLLVANKRLSETNRDLLKATLALSGTSAGQQMAGAMEGTDRVAASAPPAMPGRPVPQGYAPRVPREIGS
jgi:hypothetical protein